MKPFCTKSKDGFLDSCDFKLVPGYLFPVLAVLPCYARGSIFDNLQIVFDSHMLFLFMHEAVFPSRISPLVVLTGFLSSLLNTLVARKNSLPELRARKLFFKNFCCKSF